MILKVCKRYSVVMSFMYFIWLMMTYEVNALQCNTNKDCDELVCINSLCMVCKQDDDCDRFEVCHLVSRSSDTNFCKIKSVFDVTARDIVGSIFAFVGAMLAAGGGLGGGGIFVPVFVLIIGMQTKQAIAISACTIFAGSVVNMAFNIPLYHPRRPLESLIDWKAILMFTPALLAGTTVGVIFNIMFPAWLITCLLAITLVYASVRTTKKAIMAFREETCARREKQEIRSQDSIEMQSMKIKAENINDNDNDGEHRHDSSRLSRVLPASPSVKAAASNLNDYQRNDGALAELLQVERAQTSKLIAAVASIAVFVLIFSLLRGGNSQASSIAGVVPCSTVYWILSLFYLLCLFIITMVIGKWMYTQTVRKQELNWIADCSEIVWCHRNTTLYPGFAVFAGLLGGLLGIGGGMILGPLLLELGLHSRAVSATSATAVFITASAAAVQFFILDAIIYDYAVWFMIIGFASTFIGQTIVNFLVRKYQRVSFIVMTIAAVIVVATVMLCISGVLKVLDDIQSGASLGFSPPC